MDPAQQLVAARRDQILEAAAAVFAEKGFHPTTIRDVARRAGIADGTIYIYFTSKADLLLGIFDRMQAVIHRENPAPQIGELPFRDFLRVFLSHPLKALADDNLALFRIVIAEMMVNGELRERYIERVWGPTLAGAEDYLAAQATAQGLRLGPEDARLTVRVIASIVLGLLLQRALGDEPLRSHWDDLPDFIADLIAQGLERTV
jgi:AcrR family transcriptional regulator